MEYYSIVDMNPMFFFPVDYKLTSPAMPATCGEERESYACICMYSGTPLVRPPLLHQKSGLSRGTASRQG